MKKVKISVSYFSKGKAVTSSYTANVADVETLFSNAIADANFWAYTHKGQLAVSQTLNSLHIQYLECHCDVIERVFAISTEHPKRFMLIDEQLNPQYA